MQNDQLLGLLAKARVVLDRHMFEADGAIRDDVAEMCIEIDNAVPTVGSSEQPSEAFDSTSLHSAAA